MVEATTGRIDGMGPAGSRLKRALDVLGALAILLFFAPIGIVAILGVRLSRGGPILERAHTVGLRGKPFGLWRLARPAGQESVFDQMARRAGLARLPSLFNVLVGDMSLIGPRPLSSSPHPRQGRIDDARRLEARPGVIWPRSADGEPSLGADLGYVSAGWTLSRDLEVASRYLADGLLREPPGEG